MNISAEGKIDLKDCRYIPESAGNRRLEYDDILFNNTNSSVWVGKTAWIGTIAQGLAYSNHMTRLKISGAAISPFIARQLDWLRISGYFELNCNKHVNQASISGDFLKQKVPILLPPLAEQKRIADKLDALLGRVDACRARFERVPTLLKRFRQSVLAAATTGKLTADWRMAKNHGVASRRIQIGEDSIEVPDSWENVGLRDLLDPLRPLCYGVVQPGEEVASGALLIRVQDMERGDINVDDLRTISRKVDTEYKRSKIREGDLLISVVGTIGRTAIVPANLEANIARAIARLACRNGVESRWLNYWLSCDTLQWWLASSSKEVARKTLNLSDLACAPVALPSLLEQQEIVRRVEALLAMADRIETRLATAQKTVERLTPATLAKAFRGKLVPQDPNDETAVELLSSQQVMRKGSSKTKSSH